MPSRTLREKEVTFSSGEFVRSLTWSPTVMTRCFSTWGLPRQNQHGPRGAGGGPLGFCEECEGGVGKRAGRLASGVPLSTRERRQRWLEGKVRRWYLVYPSFQFVFLPVVSVSSLQCPNSFDQRKTAAPFLPALPPPQEKYKMTPTHKKDCNTCTHSVCTQYILSMCGPT